MPRQPTSTAQRWTLAAAVLGSGIVFLDSTVVNVALPAIGHELPRLFVGQLEGQSYVYNGYLLSLSALLILAGALNDRLGRIRASIGGIARKAANAPRTIPRKPLAAGSRRRALIGLSSRAAQVLTMPPPQPVARPCREAAGASCGSSRRRGSGRRLR